MKITSARVNEWVRLYGYEEAARLILEHKKKNKQTAENIVKQSKKIHKNSVLNTTKNKKIRKQKKKEWKEQIKKFASNLETNIPKSEQWFRSLYEKHYKCDSDIYNAVFYSTYISDVLNHKYRYIIEIDGDIHNELFQMKKDVKKDIFYRNKKYKCFRIKAYNIDQYINVLKEIQKIRKEPFNDDFYTKYLTKP